MPAVSLRPAAQGDPDRRGEPSSRRRGRRVGVEIKPGSVKQARHEAGLSLAQVARGDISRTAIYFVETGKSKPSIETLRLIAERTGQPVEYFLLDPDPTLTTSGTAVAELERLIATGDNAGVVEAGELLLARNLSPEVAATAKQIMALALLRQAEPVKGRRLASSARAYFEQTGDLMMVAECLATEASAAYLLQEPAALQIAEAALATVRTLKPVPRTTESRALFVLAATNSSQQNWEKAIELYQQGIEATDEVRDLRGLSLMYANISVAYQELGQFNQAARYSRQALALHEMLNDTMSLARSENNLGLLLVRMGDLGSGRAHLDRALSLFDEAGLELGKGGAILSLSELFLTQSNFEAAEQTAREALAISSRLNETKTVGESHLWLGKIAAAQGQDDVADTQFAAAVSALEGTNFRESQRQVHTVYAEILEKRGDLLAANVHLRRALAIIGSTTWPASTDSATA